MNRTQFTSAGFVCVLLVVVIIMVRWQEPQPRHVGEPWQAAHNHKRPDKPALFSLPPHHETTDSDDWLFVSSLAAALGDADIGNESEEDPVVRLRDLAGRAEPPSEFRRESGAFTTVADANRFLQERQFRARIGGDGFLDGQRILVGWMDEIVLTGERTRITFRGRPCAAVRIKGEQYELGVRPVIKLSLPSSFSATIYLTGFGPLDHSTHRVSLDEACEQIQMPPDAEPVWSGWVVIPAFHVHLLHRAKKLEGPSIYRALNAFSVKCQWPPGDVQPAADDSVVLDEHFNMIVARDRSPFACVHVGPWAFAPEPDML